MSKKKSPKDDGPRFTGGDHLTGFDKIVHDLMMRNELINGYHGYEIRLAKKKGNSGLSFGGNQMDMGRDLKHADLFEKILKNAKTNKGEKIFSEAELPSIVGDKNCKLRERGKTPQEIFGKNLERVNTALASEYGIKEINGAYPIAIKKMKEKVQAAINAMKNPAAKAFYSTDFGRALLCDYENQYGLKLDGAFIEKYINGPYNGKFKTDYDSKKPITVSTKTYSQKDHEKYLRSTKQWAKDYEMVDKRLLKTLNLLLDYGLYDEGPLDLSKVVTQKALQCSVGYHAVKACIVHYPPSKLHPKGLTTLRRAHCAKNPVKKKMKKRDRLR